MAEAFETFDLEAEGRRTREAAGGGEVAPPAPRARYEPRSLDDYDRSAAVEAALRDGREQGPGFVLLLGAVRRLLAAVAAFRELHGDCEDRGCSLCYDVGPLEYLARHFRDMFVCECPSAAGVALEDLPDGTYEQQLALLQEVLREYEQELAEGAPPASALARLRRQVARHEAEHPPGPQPQPQPDAVVERGSRS